MTNTKETIRTTASPLQQEHKSAWLSVLDSFRERRALRASLKSTERELSTYTTPAELQDLDAMVERLADDNDEVYGPIIERIRLRAA